MMIKMKEVCGFGGNGVKAHFKSGSFAWGVDVKGVQNSINFQTKARKKHKI